MKKSLSIIRIWLYIGLIMVFIQVLIGGITRLTDSGLSITDWDVFKGILPPVNEVDWQIAFEKYKNHAKRQFEVLHGDMTISEFKWIYFWEWFHRLWARIMGFVFLLPLIYFICKKWISKKLGWRLAIIFGLAALEAIFGIIMVMSGLNNDDRTWVSAYKLVIHLGIAAVLFGYIYWTILGLKEAKLVLEKNSNFKRWPWVLLSILFLQIIFGGLMAGMRAAIIYPYYPIVSNLGLFIQGLSESVGIDQVIDYEPSIVIKSWVQLIHRFLAIVLLGLSFYIYNRMSSKGINLKWIKYTIVGITAQYILGVITIIFSRGSIPVVWGVLHQGMALIVLLLIIHLIYRLRYRSSD